MFCGMCGGVIEEFQQGSLLKGAGVEYVNGDKSKAKPFKYTIVLCVECTKKMNEILEGGEEGAQRRKKILELYDKGLTKEQIDVELAKHEFGGDALFTKS
jgi:hypothetical protein